jgi:hypothetical protein
LWDGVPDDVMFTSVNGVREEVWNLRSVHHLYEPSTHHNASVLPKLVEALLVAVDAHVPALPVELDEALNRLRFFLPDEVPVEYNVSVKDQSLDIRLGYQRDYEECSGFVANLIRYVDRLSIPISLRCDINDVGGQAEETFPMAKWLHRFGYDLAGLEGPVGYSRRHPIMLRLPGDPDLTIGQIRAAYEAAKGDDLKLEDYLAALESYRQVPFGETPPAEKVKDFSN